MAVEDVARAALDAMFAGKRVIVPGGANRWAAIGARYLPRGRVLRKIRAIQEERRRQTLAARARGTPPE
jgi:hypothetical protein